MVGSPAALSANCGPKWLVSGCPKYKLGSNMVGSPAALSANRGPKWLVPDCPKYKFRPPHPPGSVGQMGGQMGGHNLGSKKNVPTALMGGQLGGGSICLKDQLYPTPTTRPNTNTNTNGQHQYQPQCSTPPSKPNTQDPHDTQTSNTSHQSS